MPTKYFVLLRRKPAQPGGKGFSHANDGNLRNLDMSAQMPGIPLVF